MDSTDLIKSQKLLRLGLIAGVDMLDAEGLAVVARSGAVITQRVVACACIERLRSSLHKPGPGDMAAKQWFLVLERQ